MTLREAYEDLQSVGEYDEGVPLMVQLVENPNYSFPGITFFHGAVDLQQHDCIHLILGRGLLPKDEAFAIGFTMGSTKKVTTTEETLYSWISKYFYPNVYKFSDEDLNVFRDAIRLAYISSCQPLDEIDFDTYLDKSLTTIRNDIGLEKELILAYYAIEKKRYPHAVESQRLL